MSVLEGIPIDLQIVLGSTSIPIRQVLKMSRGAMIPLDCGQDDPTRVYVNDRLVAEGRIPDPAPSRFGLKGGAALHRFVRKPENTPDV